jgi:endo-1,4-beta-D-glucanase Y
MTTNCDLLKKKFLLVMGIICSGVLFAQNRPFPQNVNYGYGFKASNITTAKINTNYINWKTKYLKTCVNGNVRVETFSEPNRTITFSEGQGYGMMIAAYMGDKIVFDKLWSYAKSMLNSRGVMGWQSDCYGFTGCAGKDESACGSPYGFVSATDGDLDIAMGLCIASNQWGGSYSSEAISYINNLKANNFRYSAADGRWIQEWRDGGDETWGNTSYWCPGFYRVFKDFTGDNAWDAIAADTYTLLLGTRNATTGFNGNSVSVNMTTRETKVDYNGARSPWRYVMDYLWTGNQQAKDLTDKLTYWANSQGITTLIDGYEMDGTRAPGYNWTASPAWTGAWACGSMSTSKEIVDKFSAHFDTCNYDGYYFSTLRIIYELVLTGNFWRPVTSPVNTSSVVAIPGRIEAEAYTNSLGVEKESTTDGNGGLDVKSIDQGDWMDYRVNVPVQGNYTVYFRVASATSGRQFQLRSNGTVLTTVAVPNTGGWQNWQTVSRTINFTTPGTRTLRINATSGNWNINWFDIKRTGNGPTRYEAESASLTGTEVFSTTTSDNSGTGYVQGLDAEGDKMTFNVNVSSAGIYKLLIRYAACNNQQNIVKINGIGGSELFIANGSCINWQDKEMTVKLNAGNNSISIEKEWGWMPVDYIEISGCTNCPVNLIAAKTVELIEEKQLFVSNPVRDRLYVKLPESTDPSVFIQVTDLSGRRLIQKRIQGAVSNQIIDVDVSKLTAGLYIVTVQRGKKIVSKKIIVEK